MSDFKGQVAFFRALCRWGAEMERRGFEVTGGDYYRDPRVTFPYDKCPAGTCYHGRRLAMDVNLFKDGTYITDLEGWREAGEYWESLGGTWGGRFRKPDPNHLSWGEGVPV